MSRRVFWKIIIFLKIEAEVKVRVRRSHRKWNVF